MGTTLRVADPAAKRLVTILATHAANFRGGTHNFYADLVRSTKLPSSWHLELAGGWSGDPKYDARYVIAWALGKGANPQAREWTTLGSLLLTLLDDETLGIDDSSFVVALIDVFQLCRDQAARQSLRLRYGVPQPVEADAQIEDEGADFDWRGPTDQLELQAFVRPEPPLLDVDFLARGIQCAAAVCHISIPTLDRTATGFLVGAGLVLTNHHVLRYEPDEDMNVNARDAELRFQRVVDATRPEGATFKLDPTTPVVQANSALDYVLLRIEPDFEAATSGSKWLAPARLSSRTPNKGTGINILQHPRGDNMKLSVSSNGITGVYEGDGILQYVSRVAGGSSGAPCFDDVWNVVALHHGARSKPFGRVGEGILMGAVMKEIEAFL